MHGSASHCGDCLQVLSHGCETSAAGLRSFDKLLDTDQEFRKVHLLAKLCEIWLDLGVLEVHLLACVVYQRGVKSTTSHERSDHFPVSKDMKDESCLLAARAHNLDKFVRRCGHEVSPDIGAGFAHDGL